MQAKFYWCPGNAQFFQTFFKFPNLAIPRLLDERLRVFGGIWKYRGHASPPPEIFTIRLSKMQFPTFPEPEWKVFKGVKKSLKKVKYLTDMAIIVISLQLFEF